MIISIKSSASGGSSRGLVHYLAHSKLDRAKEETHSREFFNESENDLDVRQANQKLSFSGEKPKAEELLHIVIAPSKEEVESVGNDLETKKAALKAIVRETVVRLEKEVKAKHLKWIAALHFNTDNPHAHLALQKEFVNENGRTENLRITRQMLHYNSRQEDGEKTLHKGALILAAEGKLREIAGEHEKARDNNHTVEAENLHGKSKIETGQSKQIPITNPKSPASYGEQRILAEEMLIKAELTLRKMNIENLIEHGDKKRFKIKDEATGTTRHVSLFDIERKIAHLSRRKAHDIYPRNAKKRAASLSKIAETERVKFMPVINQLETVRRHVLGFENRHLSEAQEKQTRLHNQKLLIEKKYERLKTDSPLPLFTPDEIQQLQAEAIREQNIEKTLFLEKIRHSNALELNRPSRRESDLEELLGAKIVAGLKLEAAEKRLADFPRTKDFIKIKIGNSFWSHNSLEQHKNQNTSKNSLLNQIKANTLRLVFRSENKNSADKKLDYLALHNQVSDALEILEITRCNEIEKQKEFVQTLDQILQADTNPNKTNLAPAFSAFELAEVEDLAQSVGRIDFYEKSLDWQKNFLLEKSAAAQNNPTNKEQQISIKTELQKNQSEGAEKIIGNFISERAAARVVLANLKVAEAQENIARYDRNKMFIKHSIKDTKTGAERELSLQDVAPKKHYYLLDKIIQKALETKEEKQERDLVRQAADIKEKELKLDLAACQTLLSRLENQKNSIQTKYELGKEISPVFTPKEIAALDARKYQTTDKREADQLAKIIIEAEKKTSVARIQDLLNNTAKELETLLPNLSKKLESENSPLIQKNAVRQLDDKTQEIGSQNISAENNIQPAQNYVKTEIIEREKTSFKEKGRSR